MPNAYGRHSQDQEQQIGPVNRTVNANELFQLQGEHGESNITSVANNVSARGGTHIGKGYGDVPRS